MKKEILSEEINAMKYLLGYKRGVVISEQQVGNQKFNFNANPALTQGGINYTPTSTADMYKNAQAAVAGVTTPATGTTATQQKFNFNPNPNLNPESGINFKPQTPEEMAKGVASATPAAAPATAAPATNLSMPDLIKQIQTILKTKFNATLGNTGPNKDGIDGVWGKNSQTAFENALKTLSTQPAAAAPTSGTPAPAAGAPVSGTTSTTQQKFNFNPNPNLNPESGINFKPSTPKLQ